MKTGFIGLGLIGGSIAVRLSKNHTVLGMDSNRESAEYALGKGIISRIADISEFKECDVVFVATPVNTTADCVREVFNAVGSDAVITDVASVKRILPGLSGARIVGGHPMAGTEASGIKAAKEYLFENAYYVLVSYEDTLPADYATVEGLVRELGARSVAMTAEEHDAQVAGISHMPHMVSYALASTPDDLSIAGTGFYDMTRIAGSDPSFWRNIMSLNRANILSAVDGFIGKLGEMRAALADCDYGRLEKLFEAGREKRVQLEKSRPHLDEYFISVDIKDEVGALERISGLLAAENINVSSISIANSREGTGGALRLGFRKKDDCGRAAAILKRSGYICDI